MKIMRCGCLLVVLMGFRLGWAGTDDEWVHAVTRRDISTLEELVTRVADVNLSTKEGKTALMLAAGERRTDLMRKLLQAGAIVDLANDRGARR